MIFFSNAEGTITAVVSSPVYQGSNYANEVVFVGPFVTSSKVTVSFIKPNGECTPAAIMTGKTLTGIEDEKGNAVNAWEYLVPSAFTEYSGVMTAQFKITNGDTVLATASSSYNVQKGVPNVTPDPAEDIYQQILSELSNLDREIENLKNGSEQIEKANQAKYYTLATGESSGETIEEAIVRISTGGISVVANPDETGTETLARLKVGETIYNIPDNSEALKDYETKADAEAKYDYLLDTLTWKIIK